MTTVQSAPKQVRENIARAKAQLRRGDLPRSIEAMIEALNALAGLRILGPSRFETQIGIQEYVTDLNRSPALRALFEAHGIRQGTTIAFACGQELALATKLGIIHKALEADRLRRESETEAGVAQRKATLLSGGQAQLRSGDLPRGRSILRRAAEEFGHERGILSDIGELLAQAGLGFEAAEMFESAIAAFPDDSRAYSGAIENYLKLGEYAKTEAIYMAALRQFGSHPQTFLNMAKMYLAWHKKDKAWEYADRAFKADPKNQDARVLIETLENRAR